VCPPTKYVFELLSETTKDGAFVEPSRRNQWQSAANGLSAKTARTSEIRCRGLHGKEGVCGSSPQEGFNKGLQISPFHGLKSRRQDTDVSPEPVPTPGGPRAIWLEQAD